MFNRNILLTAVLACSLIGITSCGGKAENKVQEQKGELVASQSEDNAVPLFDTDSCYLVSILNEESKKIVMSEKDRIVVLSYLNSVMYNKERNDSGRQYKMVNPSYTFEFEIKSGNKLAQLWLSESLLHFEGKWYNILSQFPIEPVLEKY